MRLNDKLLQVIHLRKTYPDASLMELIDEYEVLYGETITKSGLNHRFKKIKDLANELRNEG
nr:helix-turn-helix domain-containing protein [Acholeplasma laidlawii]